MNIKLNPRRWLLDSEEISVLDFGVSYLRPKDHFYLYEGERWDSSATSYSDLYWGRGKRIGWIQNISLDLANHLATIGHFAIEKELVGLGLGTRLAHAFGQEVKLRHGIKQICFDERKQDPSYQGFFTNGLGALQQPSPSGYCQSWLWQIP
jgi:hypothetical protein